jgi:N-acetyl-anhydromuramyl-L-alanine amidase AmpD
MLKKGDTGEHVAKLQEALAQIGYFKIVIDGQFGAMTEAVVKDFQAKNGLVSDGIVGPRTLEKLYGDTSLNKGTQFEKYLLSPGRMMPNKDGIQVWVPNYWTDQQKPEWCFLHHTAGNANPYQTIDIWDKDSKTVATRFVVGGQSLAGKKEYDGKILECLPSGAWAAHLTIGATKVHRESVGVEICNYGGLTKGGFFRYDAASKRMIWIAAENKYYNAYGTIMPDEQVYDCGENYRFNRYFHKYTLRQIEATREILLHLKSEGIEVSAGLQELIKSKGVAVAFGYFPDYIAKAPGLYTHGNIFQGKNDIFPQKEMVDMIMTL